MSKKIFFDCVSCDVLYDHPYEPKLCKRQLADIYVFRHSDYGSVYDSSRFIVKFLYGEISSDSLLKDYGVFIIPLYHDIKLRVSTFSVYKRYFDFFDCSSEFDFYMKKFCSRVGD